MPSAENEVYTRTVASPAVAAGSAYSYRDDTKASPECAGAMVASPCRDQRATRGGQTSTRLPRLTPPERCLCRRRRAVGRGPPHGLRITRQAWWWATRWVLSCRASHPVALAGRPLPHWSLCLRASHHWCDARKHRLQCGNGRLASAFLPYPTLLALAFIAMCSDVMSPQHPNSCNR